VFFRNLVRFGTNRAITDSHDESRANIQILRSIAMNRISSYFPQTQPKTQGHPALRAERKLRMDTDAMLRDVAFVLKMTQRVKAEILDETANENLAV